MLNEAAVHMKEGLHETGLAQLPLVERGLFQAIDLTARVGDGILSRFHWVQVLEGFALAFLVWISGRQVLPRGGWRGFLRYCFPKELYTHRSAIVDYQLMVVNAAFGFLFNVTWRLNTVFFTALFVSGLSAWLGPVASPWAWTTGALIAVTVLILLAEDFGNYLFHVLGHKVPMLWALHRVHHSAEVLTPLTAFRTHPLEYVLAGNFRAVFTALALGPVVYLFGGPPGTLEIFGIGAVVIAVGGLGTVIQHSHIWLSFGWRLNHVFCAPCLHALHHSQAPEHWDRNYGVIFSFWDWIFGTLVVPRSGPVPLTLGIAGEARPPHPNAMIAWLVPLWEMVPGHDRMLELALRHSGPQGRRLAERWCLLRERVRPAVVAPGGGPVRPGGAGESTA